MTTAQIVETSVTVNNNSPIQDYVHPDSQTQPTFEITPGFKTFHIANHVELLVWVHLVSAIQSSGLWSNYFHVVLFSCTSLEALKHFIVLCSITKIINR